MPTLRDELIHDFLQAVYGKGLHPEDAAIEVGVPIETFVALRKENPAVDSAWLMSELKEKGKLSKPRTVLEMKHSLSFKLWRRLEPRVLAMIDRIDLNPKDEKAAEKADEKIMELLKHKIISETLPKESYGQVDQNLNVETDAYAGKSEEELFAIAEKRFGQLADLKSAMDRAAVIREKLSGGKVIDVEYQISDPRTASGDGSPAGEVQGQSILSVPVEPEAVGSDGFSKQDDNDSRSEPVQRQNHM